MRVTFLGQGFEPTSPNSVGNKLMDFLSSSDYNSFFGISAFASAAGVKGLSTYLEIARPNFQDLTIIVGIDQNGTSVEALEEILALSINSYIFYQNEPPIFHPKIYLFEGNNHNKIILGSSNLTANGLFSNHEGSLMVEFDSTDTDGLQLLNEIKDYYSTLFDLSDPNLFEINRGNIDSFLTDGVISREPTRVQQNKKVRQTGTRTINIPNRLTPKIPPEFRRPRKSQGTTSTAIIQTTSNGEETSYERGDLVWTKESLSRSDAQMVPAGSNPTGNLKLSQAGFHSGGILIDQTVYFRNSVFNHLTWNHPKTANPNFEESHIWVLFTIAGNNYEPVHIRLSHDIARIAGQGNTPTWLHWGPEMTPIISSLNLNGRRLDLFRTDNPAHFIIEIH